MPALLHHVAALELLARDPEGLPPDFARALAEDLEYARFGAALPSLPRFDGVRGVLGVLTAHEKPSPYASILHGDQAVRLGLKMAELVGSGALVGREAGMAFLAGYFTHLCVDRALSPIVQRLVKVHCAEKESPDDAKRRIEALWASLYAREAISSGGPRHGDGEDEAEGDPRTRDHLRVQKRSGPPVFGVGRGLYELIRVSLQAELDVPLPKSELDGWVRGLWLYGQLLSSPVGKLTRLPSHFNLSYRELYRGDGVDVPAATAQAVDRAKQVLVRLSGLVQRRRSSRIAREKFLAELPERVLGHCAG